MSDHTNTWSFTRETSWQSAMCAPIARRAPALRAPFGASFRRETFSQSYLMPPPDLAGQLLEAVKPTAQANCLPLSIADRHATPNQKGSNMSP